MGLVLVFSLTTSLFTCKVWAKGGTPVYQLQESSIVYKVNQKKILLDLAHHDSALDNGCSYGQYNEREIANKITLQVKQLLEAEGIDVDLTRSYDDVISIADRVKLANSSDYDYFISIHINSSGTENQGTGVEAFACNGWSISNSIIKELQNEFGYVNRGIFESEFYNKRINDKSTLLEIGFLNNEYDRNNLVNHQEQYAAAIARGIINQLNKE